VKYLFRSIGLVALHLASTASAQNPVLGGANWFRVPKPPGFYALLNENQGCWPPISLKGGRTCVLSYSDESERDETESFGKVGIKVKLEEGEQYFPIEIAAYAQTPPMPQSANFAWPEYTNNAFAPRKTFALISVAKNANRYTAHILGGFINSDGYTWHLHTTDPATNPTGFDFYPDANGYGTFYVTFRTSTGPEMPMLVSLTNQCPRPSGVPAQQNPEDDQNDAIYLSPYSSSSYLDLKAPLAAYNAFNPTNLTTPIVMLRGMGIDATNTTKFFPANYASQCPEIPVAN
jgi:hypothetical protein